jgi:hypothetical protein
MSIFTQLCSFTPFDLLTNESASFATECSIKDLPNSASRQWAVSSIFDLDAILLSCTTLVDGNIIIGMNFSGNFNLNGITNMTGEFYFPRRIIPTVVPVPGFVTMSKRSRSFQLPRIPERSMLTPVCFGTGICGQPPRKVTMRRNT